MKTKITLILSVLFLISCGTPEQQKKYDMAKNTVDTLLVGSNLVHHTSFTHAGMTYEAYLRDGITIINTTKDSLEVELLHKRLAK